MFGWICVVKAGKEDRGARERRYKGKEKIQGKREGTRGPKDNNTLEYIKWQQNSILITILDLRLKNLLYCNTSPSVRMQSRQRIFSLRAL